MSDDNKFWVWINAIIAITILGITYLTTNYWIDHNTKIVDLIKGGTDPIAAICAIQDDHGDHPTCLILAAQKGLE